MSFRIIKCAIVGDGTIGKTTFLTKYCTNITLLDYIPTVVDTYESLAQSTITNETVKIMFMDLSGQEDYRDIRDGQYDYSIDVFIVAFSIDNIVSFENIKDKWIPEIHSNCKVRDVPLILMGTKLDIRMRYELNKDSRIRNCVQKKQGLQLAKQIYAPYIECSSISEKNLSKVIDEIIKISANQKRKKTDTCIIS